MRSIHQDEAADGRDTREEMLTGPAKNGSRTLALRPGLPHPRRRQARCDGACRSGGQWAWPLHRGGALPVKAARRKRTADYPALPGALLPRTERLCTAHVTFGLGLRRERVHRLAAVRRKEVRSYEASYLECVPLP